MQSPGCIYSFNLHNPELGTISTLTLQLKKIKYKIMCPRPCNFSVSEAGVSVPELTFWEGGWVVGGEESF